MDNYIIKPLSKEDYYNGFLQLLEQLTSVHSNEISYTDFSEHFDKLKSQIFVVKHNNKIIATASIFIESKFIHKLSFVAHIEDVVIDSEYRKCGLGKMMINHCINYAHGHKCYKIILNCAKNNIKFYEKCGFTNKNVEMSIYL